MHLEVVRGYLSVLMALARDFPSAMAVRARLLSLAYQYVRERRQAQLPQDDLPKAGHQTGPLAARARKALPRQALRALLSVPDDELASPQAL